MKKIVKAGLLLWMLAAGNNYAWADEEVSPTTQGTLCGRVVDASKQTLPGASIYIEKLHTGVTSDINGFYTFCES